MPKHITPYRDGAKIMVGEVVKISSNKTIVVKVMRRVKHPMGKLVTKSAKFLVHDEQNQAEVGKTVQIYLVRPISKNKTWAVVPDLDTQEESS